MNKTIYMLVVLCGICAGACKEDDGLGAPAVIEPDYVLPQGNASQEDNDRIQALYDTYGSYFLYNVTQKDFEWVQSTGSGNSAIDSIVLGDPAYVGDMLDYLDDIWLDFLPEAFKKGPALPYRVIMVDTIKQRRGGTGWPPGMEYLYSDFKITGRAITVAGMNASLRTMTSEEKVAKRNALLTAIWGYYIGNGIIHIPAAFHQVSNYVTVPATPITTAYPENREAFRQRGFLPSGYLANGNTTEWYSNAYSWTNAKTNDLNSFMLHLLQRTDEQMEPYLQYPLIKQKFDLLTDHFMTEYGIDVRAIANTTY